jgi:hypothetical protein
MVGEKAGVISDETRQVWKRLDKNIPVQTRGIFKGVNEIIHEC